MDRVSSTALEKLICPECKTTMTLNPDGSLTCPACGKGYGPPERLCPICGQIGQQGADQCGRCDTELVRVCAQCGTRNWSGASRCRQCGTELEIVGLMAERLALGTSGRLRQQMEASAEIKEREEVDSQRRMDSLWQKEHQRQQEIAAARSRQKEQERMFIRLTLIGGLGILIAAIILIVLMSLLNPAPAPQDWLPAMGLLWPPARLV
jgi:ribosomal protein L40E